MRRPVFVSSFPFIYLHQAGLLDLLPRMYERVITVPLVHAELDTMRRMGFYSPPCLRDYDWIDTISPVGEAVRSGGRITVMNASLFSLATAYDDALVLVEDRHLRREVDKLEIASSGTVGVLLMAKRLGLLDAVKPALPLLAEAGLSMSNKARLAVLVMAKEV